MLATIIAFTTQLVADRAKLKGDDPSDYRKAVTIGKVVIELEKLAALYRVKPSPAPTKKG